MIDNPPTFFFFLIHLKHLVLQFLKSWSVIHTFEESGESYIAMTKSRSISTVEGSGAASTRIFFELFFQNR